MARATRALLAVLTFSIAALGLGYGSAWLWAPQCRAEIAQELTRRPVFGRNFGGGRVRVTPADVSSRVVGPFQVETSYMVPADLHGVVHIQRFRVLPWGIARSTAEVIYLV
jgi:hypothetical protein